MARGINKVILVGNLGQDPELRYTGSSTAVCNMRLATGDRYKSSDGEWVDRTEWHDLVAWERLAEICDQYLTKGSRIYVEGQLQTRSWDDRDGNTRYSTEVKIREMLMLDGRGGENTPNRPRTQEGHGGRRPTSPGKPREHSGLDDQPGSEDTLPF